MSIAIVLSIFEKMLNNSQEGNYLCKNKGFIESLRNTLNAKDL